ncbi:hypothetical protein SUGI_1074140 [Cryptomeria japonica]|nr:hypothetical protein SUGI_1074140 [Cryptomeria japonica]
MGVRAKPLDGSATLKAKHLYFLIELPKLENYQCAPRRIRSGIAMNAKSRLENMLLARRSISDISYMNCEPSSDTSSSEISEDNGAVRVKVRMRRAELIEMMAESHDSSQTAERILESCLNSVKSHQTESRNVMDVQEEKEDNLVWRPSLGSIPETCRNPQVNQVRFRSVQNQEVL